MADDSIAVVIPVFNAAAFLAQALSSVQAQTYPATEIIVVDDGSTDGSLGIAEYYARSDDRIRTMRQIRRGPGAARNLGIAACRSELIAPLDADDLWQPVKLQRQIEALRDGGIGIGLVYTWFALIDMTGKILSTGHHPTAHGDVLRECCRANIVGNGSGALMRKSAVLECGGYDEHLAGCEDYRLYIAMAERYQFAVVPEHLTGYRQTVGNLTGRVELMLRSANEVLTDLEHRHPDMRPEIILNRLDLCHWLVRRAAQARNVAAARKAAGAMWEIDRSYTVKSLARLPLDLLTSNAGGGPKARVPFLSVDPSSLNS